MKGQQPQEEERNKKDRREREEEEEASAERPPKPTWPGRREAGQGSREGARGGARRAAEVAGRRAGACKARGTGRHRHIKPNSGNWKQTNKKCRRQRRLKSSPIEVKINPLSQQECRSGLHAVVPKRARAPLGLVVSTARPLSAGRASLGAKGIRAHRSGEWRQRDLVLEGEGGEVDPRTTTPPPRRM
ncbi:uncharacterized protein LOC122443918 isoform X3 [Cervus canadensis]|uniref:uncharacterized protein LOC122443918 isoform X3 n=1 Tax=Cervus canadensis TaxID=1574408 RepID=UPI001C9E8CF6|nr:uncharacterized protein LOC122443918 isoform X3 [Cervus canadensis]